MKKDDSVLEYIRRGDTGIPDLDADEAIKPRGIYGMFNIKNPEWWKVKRYQDVLWNMVANHVQKRLGAGK